MKTLILFATLLPFTGYAQLNRTNNSTSQRTISVTGEAVVKIEPDEVVIHCGVETHGKEIEATKLENRKVIQASIKLAKEKGIREQDLKTEYLHIEPRWDSSYSREGFRGYWMRNSFTVILKDTTKFEDLTSSLLQAGVTHIHNINFRTSEFKKHRDQARLLAIKAAKEKAELLAGALDCEVTHPININEQNYGNWFYHSGWWGGSRNHMATQNVIQNVSSSGQTTNDDISLGKISIKGTVTVTFAIKGGE